MIYLKRSFSLLLIVVLALSCVQTQDKDEIRVLFIGNSYTYYNSTPELVKALIQEKFSEQVVKTQLIVVVV